MFLSISILSALAMGASAPSFERVNTGLVTQAVACANLKRTVANIDHLPLSGPVGIGWFCDFMESTDSEWYVIALRSNRRCEGICSNLMGWYAVDRTSGKVHAYDVAELSVGPQIWP